MQGKCYWCNKQTTISKVPVAGIRLCSLCLAEIGYMFLQALDDLKTLDIFKAPKTSETVLLVLKHLNEIYHIHKEVDIS